MTMSRFGRLLKLEEIPVVLAVGAFDWKDAICDGSIVGGISAFSTYTGMVTSGATDYIILRTCFIAFCAAFLGFLAIKRGLIKGDGK